MIPPGDNPAATSAKVDDQWVEDIPRLVFKVWVVFVLIGLSIGLLAAPARSQSKLPNIVLLVADDLGYGDLGCYGHPRHRTPHIDGLATDGVRLTDAYACAPNCAPSRACLVSGRYAPRHGIYTVGNSARGKAKHRKLVPTPNRTNLRSEEQTIAELLAPAGYRCAVMGKWHLGPDPKTQGFAVNVGGNSAGHPKSYFSPYRNADLSDGPKGEYLTDRMATEAVSFVREAAEGDQPFLLYLPFYSVHTPIQAPKDRVQEVLAQHPELGRRAAKYQVMVESVDRAVGRVLDAVSASGAGDNTVVIFTSDNGGVGGIARNAPLRGAKGMLYEGGIRVPFLARLPKPLRGRLAAGSVLRTPVIGVDVLPTLLALAKVEHPEGVALDGVDLLSLLQDGTSVAAENRPLFWHFPAYLQGRSDGRGPWRTTPAGAMRRGAFKLIEWFEDDRVELYEVGEDRGERDNLAQRHPGIVVEMRSELRAWRQSVGAPVPTEREPAFDAEARRVAEVPRRRRSPLLR